MTRYDKINIVSIFFYLLVKIMKKPCCCCCDCRSIERQWFSNLAVATAATVTAGAIREFLARGEGRKLRCPIRNRGRPQKEPEEECGGDGGGLE
jgi:hypothetical protein